MKALQPLEAWHKTRFGSAVFAAVELLLAYLLASRAIDTGSWWEYSFAALLLVGTGRNLVRLIKGK